MGQFFFQDTEQASRKSKKRKRKNLALQEAKHLTAEHKLNQSDIIYVTHCYVGVFSEV